MKLTSTLVLASSLAMATTASAGSRTLFSVGWGSGDSQLGYYNHTVKGFDQPYSEGPGGIALGPNGEIWISDTMNHRVLRFDQTGKQVAAVTALGGQALQRPMALWLSGAQKICVIDTAANRVLGLDREKDKLVLLSTTQSPHELAQPESITGLASGDIWVGDFGTSKAHRYDAAGTWKEERAWGGMGLFAERDGTLYTLEYRQPAAGQTHGEIWLISYDAKGQKSDRMPLVAPELESPELIGLDGAGSVYVRYYQPLPKDNQIVVKYDSDGTSGVPLGEFPKTVTRQSWLVTAEGRVLGLSFDSKQAPQGKVDVVELTAP